MLQLPMLGDWPSTEPKPNHYSRPPDLDENLLRFLTAVGVDGELLNNKKSTAAWEEEYKRTHTGLDAVNAAKEAGDFQLRMHTARKKYSGANGREAEDYFKEKSEEIRNNSVESMIAYAAEQGAAVVNRGFAEQEEELRKLLASPQESAEARKLALDEHVFKVENWRISQGEKKEDVENWKSDFKRSLASDSLHSRFENLLTEAPSEALKLARLARGGGAADANHPFGVSGSNTPGNEADAASLRGTALEYAAHFPAEDLRFMEKRAETASAARSISNAALKV